MEYKCIQTFPFTSEHELIGIVGDGEDVWWSLLTFFAPVCPHYFLVVDWEPLVRVNSDTEQPRVGLYNVRGKAVLGNDCQINIKQICRIQSKKYQQNRRTTKNVYLC